MAGDNQVPLEILIQIRDEIAGLNRARAGLQGAKEDADGLGTALRQGLGIGTGMQLAVGAVALLRSTLQATAGEAFRLAGEIQDQSQALGLSARVYQTLRLEFQAAGADAGRLGQAIGSQIRSLAEARDSSTAAAKAYRDLGLSAAGIEKLPIEERLIAVARATLGAKDQTLAYAAAAQILGDRGLAKLLAALEKLGIEGTDSIARLYEKQGLLLSDDSIGRLDRAEKSWARFWQAIVIGSGEAIAMIGSLADSLKKDFFGTAFDVLKSTGGLPSTDLLDRLARDQAQAASSKPRVKPPGSPGPTVDSAAVEAAAATLNALKKAGEATREAVLTPYEKFDRTLAQLGEQQRAGAIDAVTFGRAQAQARAELQQALAPLNAANEALQRQGEAIHESVLTPLEKWAEKLAELTTLNTTVINGTKALSDVDFTRAAAAADQVYREATEKTTPTTPPFAGWDATADLVGRSIEGMSFAISDAVVGLSSWGQAWRNLGQIALRTLSDLIAKMLVAAAIKSVLGFFNPGGGGGSIGGGIGKIAGKVFGAGGGQFLTSGPTHFTVGDNPGGVELVSVLPISGVGQTTVNGQALAMAGGGSALVAGRGGGDTFNFSYAFSGGVSRQEVLGLIPSIVEASKSAVLEAKRRGRDGFR